MTRFPAYPHRLSRPRLQRSAIAVATAAASLIGSVAHADQGLRPYANAIERTGEGDALNYGAFELMRYDTNLFRLPNGDESGAPTTRSAITMTTGVGLHIDKTYGLQRIVIDASLTRDHYIPFSNLDFTSHQIAATLFWSVTPWLTGDVIINENRVPTDYEFSGYRTTPDPRKIQLQRLDVDLRAGAALHPRFSVFRREEKSDSGTFQLENSRIVSTEASLVYVFRTENTASIYAQRGTGDNTGDQSSVTRDLDRSFTQYEYGVRGLWVPDDQIRLTASAGHRNREFDRISARDYGGWVGSVDFLYRLTGKTDFHLTGNRNYYMAQTNDTSYHVDDYVQAEVVYDLTGKIKLRPQYAIRWQDYKGALTDTSFALKEVTRYETLQLDWALQRAVDLSFSIGRSHRQANFSGLNFIDRNASVFARVKF